MLAAYRAHDAASAVRAAADIGRDSSVGAQMANWARAQAKFSRSPAYAYFFARRQPYAPGITFIDHDPATAGAYHSAEIPYFLRTRDSLNLFRQTRIWEDVDVALEEDMGELARLVRTRRQAHIRARTGLAGIRPEAAAGRSARSRDRGRRLAELRVAGAARRGPQTLRRRRRRALARAIEFAGMTRATVAATLLAAAVASSAAWPKRPASSRRGRGRARCKRRAVHATPSRWSRARARRRPSGRAPSTR